MSSRSRCVISSPNPHRTLIIVLLGGLGAERACKKNAAACSRTGGSATEDRKPRHSSYVVARSSERAAHIHPIRRQMIEDDGPNAVRQRTATRIHSLSSRAPEDRSAPPQHGAGRCHRKPVAPSPSKRDSRKSAAAPSVASCSQTTPQDAVHRRPCPTKIAESSSWIATTPLFAR